MFDEEEVLSRKSAKPLAPSTSTSHYGNRYLDDPREGMRLLADLIRMPEARLPGEVEFEKIESLIKNEFRQILDEDRAPHSAKVWRELNLALAELREVLSFPEIENRHIVALGGQFSAGKSCFINSLLGADVLPVDTCATTAIPTYIYKSSNEQLSALNRQHHRVKLGKEALGAISHNFSSTDFKLSFSHILQLLTWESPITPYPNIVFLDTPGYSKAEKEHSRIADSAIARQHLARAHSLIWLIDISNGTLQQSDIDFLKGMDLEQPILFVLNKADAKPAAQVVEIVAATRKAVADSGLPVFDVIAYSSHNGKEYSSSGSVLKDYLSQINACPAGTFMPGRFDKALKEFLDWHGTAVQEARHHRQSMSELLPELSSKYSEKIKEVDRRYHDQINMIQQAIHDIKNRQKDLQAQLAAMYLKLKIQVVDENHAPALHLSCSTKKKAQSEAVRLCATFEIKKPEELRQFSDQGKIPCVVTKLSAIGVIIGIPGAPSAQAVISKPEMAKHTGDAPVLGSKAIMQYVSKNEVKITFS